ncbi:unnamed protein product [Cylindrotheca closterium]|uniref:Uncharacterized protein n=1 Tax=Cylindrotheca closterium TaxID=2856 RepID=A0AAD2FKS8_9STRA|nr:unnamed protein product [Cylindrotheca closterium]
MAFLLPSNAGSLSYAKANLPSKKTSSTTQHYFKSPLVQEALDQCILDRNVDPDQMIDLLENLSNEHDLRPNQSYDCQRDLQGSFEFVFSSSIAEIPLIGKRLFRGYYLPMREIIHFDFTNLTMGMEVKLLPLPNFPTFTLQGHDLQWHPNEAQLTYQFDGKDNTSVWNILYADGNMLVAKCSVHLGLVVLRRIPPLELQALNEERGHTTTATTDN